MDDLVKAIIEAKGVWGSRDRSFTQGPADLSADYAARVIALLVERVGGQVEFGPDEIRDVPHRLMLLPYAVEPETSLAEPSGLMLEIRRLADPLGSN
jgi:hypothetical protein